MNQFDRVVLTRDFSMQGITVKQGTLCTIREFLTETTALVQYDFQDGQPKYIGVPISILEKAEHLIGADPQRILPKCYHPGNVYAVGKSAVGPIVEVILHLNEMDDIIIIQDRNNERQKYKRLEFDKYGSLLPNTPETREIEEVQQRTFVQEVQTDQEDEIMIIINGFKFLLRGSEISVHEIKFHQLENFAKAVNKLNNLLHKEG